MEHIEAIVGAIIGSQAFFWLIQFFIERKFKKADKVDELDQKVAEILKVQEEQKATIEAMHEFAITESEQQELIMQTLKILSYDLIFDKLSYYIDIKKYATQRDRECVQRYTDVYHAHGWNGDIKPMLDKFNSLPTLPPNQIGGI